MSLSSVQDQAMKVINEHMLQNEDIKDMMDNRMIIWLDFEEGVDSIDKEDKNLTCGTEGSHCLSAPYVREAFASDVVIEGNFTKKSAEQLVELINSGALPTNLTEISSRTVEASFGASSLEKTLTAGVIGIIIVMIMMIIMLKRENILRSIIFF